MTTEQVSLWVVVPSYPGQDFDNDPDLLATTTALASMAKKIPGDNEIVIVTNAVQTNKQFLQLEAGHRVINIEIDPTQSLVSQYLGSLSGKLQSSDAPDWIISDSRVLSIETLSALSAVAGIGIITDVEEIQEGESLKGINISKPDLGGQYTARVQFAEPRGAMNFTSESLKNVLVDPDPGQTSKLDIELMQSTGDYLQVLSTDIEQYESEDIPLKEAQIVIAGGRGVGEDWTALEKLKQVLPGAAIGASKAAVDLNWVEAPLQIGQTGQSVAPEIYFSLGISGATQQKVGMDKSKNIVVINNDETAPVFDIADFGIVGDLHEILPLLIEKLQK